MNKKQLEKELEKLNLNLTEEMFTQIDEFCNMLIETNKTTNLTAITNIEDIYLKHVYDSLTITKVIDLTKYETLLDIGTGAGFPGIILKIVFPNLKITLLDSNGKKTKFLTDVITKLNLKNIDPIKARAEEYIITKREYFDIVTSRAVAAMDILAEISIPFVKKGNYFIALKGNIDIELERLTEINKILGANLEKIVEFDLPIEKSKRTIFKIEKIKETSKLYPRRYDQIKKNPLKKTSK